MSLYRTNNVYTCSPQYNEYLEEIQNKCYSVISHNIMTKEKPDISSNIYLSFTI